ncbi:MAG: T9SS type A sorting domain-containing protein [Bacteroidales bacterium]|nr:T9SS type A sorting domain-containing protein [Bacteroidales bacterium]
MKKQYFLSGLIIVSLLFVFGNRVQAQCPGCQLDMSFIISPAAPGISPDTMPVGFTTQYYDADIDFYLPAEFTHSSGTDVTLTKLEVLSVTGLPFGLSFQSSSANNTFFPSQNPPTTEHGCAKICGTPVFAGQYYITVFVRAYVNTVIGSQTSDDSFSIPISIVPGGSGSASFSLTNTIGCGSVTTDFITNHPSNGHSGFSYSWNFGNGSSSQSETPSTITYSNPGQYNVVCETIVDTVHFNYMNNVTILGTSCSDFLGKPDLFIKIVDLGSNILFQSPIVENQNPPVSFTIPNLQLNHFQNYTIEVWDEDALSTYEHCTTFQFSGINPGSTLTSGSNSLSFTTTRPVFEYLDTITVSVYSQPAVPVIIATPALSACQNDSILLSADNAPSYQWFKDTVLLLGQNFQTMWVFNSGKFFVVSTDTTNGCWAQSDTLEINIYNNPPKPTFWRIGDTLQTLIAGFDIQWFLNGDTILGATSQKCHIDTAGLYSLTATSAQGCISKSDIVYYQPYNIGFEEIDNSIKDFSLYPNPNSGNFYLSFNAISDSDIQISLFDILGREAYAEDLVRFKGTYQKEFNIQVRPSFYILEIKINNQPIKREKIIIQ